MDTNPKAERARSDGKLRLELLDTAMLHPTAEVLAHGAEKYGVRNWRVNPIHWSTYLGALRRHTDALANGEDIDPDSGQPHLAHISATVNVLLDAAAHGTLVDDRNFAESKTGKATTWPDDETVERAKAELERLRSAMAANNERLRRRMAGMVGDTDHAQELTDCDLEYRLAEAADELRNEADEHDRFEFGVSK